MKVAESIYGAMPYGDFKTALDNLLSQTH